MLTDNELFKRLEDILSHGPYEFPSDGPFKGTGRPGIYLEHLLDLKASNKDMPDSGNWELKFHSGTALMTLLHKDPLPRGIVTKMVLAFGSKDANGNIAFRHLIAGSSGKGFNIVNKDNKIIIKHPEHPELEPYWDHDTLLNHFAAKLRRLIVVHGQVNKKLNTVTYDSANLYWEPVITQVMNHIEDGLIKIDFDARTNPKGKGVRNHGTKLRIAYKNLIKIYQHTKAF